MKREGIIIMLLSLVISIIAALSYFSNRNQCIMNKIVIALVKSFHSNSTPVFSISILAIGEFFLWESQNNSDLIQVKTRITDKFRLMVSVIQLDILKLSKINWLTLNKLIDHTPFLNLSAGKDIMSYFSEFIMEHLIVPITIIVINCELCNSF